MYHLLQKMGLVALLLFCTLHSQNVFANRGGGDIGAVLFDPLLIDIKEAKRFCEDEPYAVKCDILLERLKEKKQKKSLITVEQSPLDQSYEIFNANFQ